MYQILVWSLLVYLSIGILFVFMVLLICAIMEKKYVLFISRKIIKLLGYGIIMIFIWPFSMGVVIKAYIKNIEKE